MEETELNRLLVAAAEIEPDSFTPPASDVIDRYILGNASHAERGEIRAAMQASPTFSRELLLMCEEADLAAEKDLSARYVEPVPLSGGSLTRSRHRATTVIWVTFAAAAILILAFTLWPGRDDTTRWVLVEAEIETEVLIPMNTRGPSTTHAEYSTGLDAALAEFRGMLVYENGEFHFRDSSYSTRALGREYILHVHDPAGNDLGDWSRGVSGDSVSVWLLTLPDRKLLHISSPDESIALDWTTAWGDRGCVTWTSRTPSGYHSSFGVAISLNRQ